MDTILTFLEAIESTIWLGISVKCFCSCIGFSKCKDFNDVHWLTLLFFYSFVVLCYDYLLLNLICIWTNFLCSKQTLL